ncbi:MAG: response regulator transcription factor [Rhodospirillaceae bacterium]
MSTADAQPHILVVEGDELPLQFVVYHLEHAGFRVSGVTTRAEMMDLLARERVDLVVLDLGLPDGDGLSRAQEVRRRSSVPIVVLTARQGEDDRLMALGLGADDYLTKPCDPRELVLRIRNVLTRGGVPCAPVRPMHPCAPRQVTPLPEARPFVERRRTGESLRRWLIGAGLVVAVALAAGVAQTMWWYKAGPEPTAVATQTPSPATPAQSTPAPSQAAPAAQPAERQASRRNASSRSP